jgi:hypothetical protein
MNECITSSRVRPGAKVQLLNTSVSLLASISGATHVNSKPLSSCTGYKWRDAGGREVARAAGVGRAISLASSAFLVVLAVGEKVVAAPSWAPAKPSEAARDRSAACVLMIAFTFLHEHLWIWMKYRLVQEFDQRKIRCGASRLYRI